MGGALGLKLGGVSASGNSSPGWGRSVMLVIRRAEWPRRHAHRPSPSRGAGSLPQRVEQLRGTSKAGQAVPAWSLCAGFNVGFVIGAVAAKP